MMTPERFAELRRTGCNCERYEQVCRCADIDELLDEVERLRAEIANHRRQLPDALENAEDHGAEKERAAIVAWLRSDAMGLGWVADAIERGEHLK